MSSEDVTRQHALSHASDISRVQVLGLLLEVFRLSSSSTKTKGGRLPLVHPFAQGDVHGPYNRNNGAETINTTNRFYFFYFVWSINN
jgi:hypothetical protein